MFYISNPPTTIVIGPSMNVFTREPFTIEFELPAAARFRRRWVRQPERKAPVYNSSHPIPPIDQDLAGEAADVIAAPWRRPAVTTQGCQLARAGKRAREIPPARSRAGRKRSITT